jgi:hypothetical protein
MVKRVKIKDQIYNGAFTNAELSLGSKKALLGSAAIIVSALLISFNINKK